MAHIQPCHAKCLRQAASLKVTNDLLCALQDDDAYSKFLRIASIDGRKRSLNTEGPDVSLRNAVTPPQTNWRLLPLWVTSIFYKANSQLIFAWVDIWWRETSHKLIDIVWRQFEITELFWNYFKLKNFLMEKNLKVNRTNIKYEI